MKKNKQTILLIILIIISLLTIDIGTRILMYKEINFVHFLYLPPFAFTISYILILLLIYYLNHKTGKIIYIITIIVFIIYSVAQIMHFNILDRAITITDILVADQATGMIDYVLRQFKIWYLIPSFICLILFILSLKLFKKNGQNTKTNKKIIILMIVLIISTRLLAITSLGNSTSKDNWNFWNIPKNVYNEYDSPSRSLIISGIYEYFFRDFYTYLRDIFKEEETDDIKIINKYIDSLDYEITPNNYTNIFKDKNLIMIMMESIDSWLVNDEVMPTLQNIKNTGIDFTNRYSPTFGGGATINTEFASLTGIYATITDKPIYKYDQNNFDYSLPNLFKENGYKVNSVHMNTGSFYNRSNFHISLGFENHYAMQDIDNTIDYQYDTNLIKEDISYNKIINKENKFLTFITTYSPHVPYINSSMCDNLDTKPFMIENDEETTCLKTLAHETDEFIKLLINRLEEDNLLESTVIVLYTDHYVYGYSDASKWTGIKDSNLSQHTTFVIWQKDINHQEIDTYTDTVDIPITLFNMFGINYNPKLYMGTDIFSNYHEEFVYFNDYTWLTKDLYYTGNQNYNTEYLKNISNKVNNKIKINEKMITSDFYKTLKK